MFGVRQNSVPIRVLIRALGKEFPVCLLPKNSSTTPRVTLPLMKIESPEVSTKLEYFETLPQKAR